VPSRGGGRFEFVDAAAGPDGGHSTEGGGDDDDGGAGAGGGRRREVRVSGRGAWAAVALKFTLPPGSFATMLLREVAPRIPLDHYDVLSDQCHTLFDQYYTLFEHYVLFDQYDIPFDQYDNI
jgi:hypothetical protein